MSDFEMYLQGNEDGDVELICTSKKCMRPGVKEPWNPDGLWLCDVGNLTYKPTALDVMAVWQEHIDTAHKEDE